MGRRILFLHRFGNKRGKQPDTNGNRRHCLLARRKGNMHFSWQNPIGGDKPKAISPVNLFAKLEDKIEIKEGEEIIIGID